MNIVEEIAEFAVRTNNIINQLMQKNAQLEAEIAKLKPDNDAKKRE